MTDPAKLIAYSLQLLILVLGCILFWRRVASPTARAARQPSPLTPWEAQSADFLVFVMHVFLGMFVGSVIAVTIARPLGITGDNLVIFSSGGSQFGTLIGVLLYSLSHRGQFQPLTRCPPNMIAGGLATFAIAQPFVIAVGIVWTSSLKAVGLPVDNQLAVDIFARTQSPLWLFVFAFTAVVIAPIAEELVFRAGVFRYLRTRVPRWAALLLPGCLFAALHFSLATYAQLVALGVVFALAYERTGHIGTAMVAHAAFNLNNVVLLLLGVDE